MKKIRAVFLLATSIVCLITGCVNNSKKQVRVEFAETESINDDIDSALQTKYTNFEIDKSVTVDKIESIMSYSYKFDKKFGGIEDNKVSQLIEFFPGKQWFDENKKTNDRIEKKYEEIAGSGFKTLMYYNYSQNKYAVIVDSGEITLDSSSGSEETDFSKIESTVSIDKLNGDEQKRAFDNSTAFLKKVFEILNEEPPFSSKMSIGENQKGEKIYKIILEQKLPKSSIDSLGTSNAVSGYNTSSGVLNDPYASLDNYIILDKEQNVISFSYNGNAKYIEGTALNKIPTLSSVLRYLDEEIAPNIKLTVSDISMKYCIGLGTNDLIPVWIIECCKNNEDPTKCTRFYVDCRNGRIDYIIEGTYGVRNVD